MRDVCNKRNMGNMEDCGYVKNTIRASCTPLGEEGRADCPYICNKRFDRNMIPFSKDNKPGAAGCFSK